jgi:hypothetical protein
MFGLDADTLRNIKKVFAALPNLEKVILYGSRAKIETHLYCREYCFPQLIDKNL